MKMLFQQIGMPTLPQRVQPGERLSANTVNCLIEGMEWLARNKAILFGLNRVIPEFSGNGYSADGVLTTGLNSTSSKPWVKYVVDTGTFSEEIGPPPSPWGSNEVWFEKANTYGNIVVTRLG